MLFIHRLASVFCFVLLILNGVDADIQDCIQGIQNLIGSTAHNWERLVNGRGVHNAEHFYFIPDDNLIKILASLPLPKSVGEISPVKVSDSKADKKSSAIIQNHVEFGVEGAEFQSVNFVVKLGSKTGKAKFVCGGQICNFRISALEQSIDNSNKFSCLTSENEMYLQPAEMNGIAITFAGQKRVIFYADLILDNLIPFYMMNPPQWTATTAVIKDKMITFNDKKKKTVGQIALPTVISDKTVQNILPVTLEYVEAAVKVVNTYKRGITLPTFHNQINSGWILGIINPEPPGFIYPAN